MKTIRLISLITAAFSLTAIATTGFAENVKVAETPAPASGADATAPQWINLKDITYDQRVQFFVGLKRMETVVDNQISALTAKRAVMTSTANTADWDFAMKELGNARSYLKSAGEVLGKATPETWSQEKDRVGQAWVRTQEAYAKVKSSMTS